MSFFELNRLLFEYDKFGVTNNNDTPRIDSNNGSSMPSSFGGRNRFSSGANVVNKPSYQFQRRQENRQINSIKSNAVPVQRVSESLRSPYPPSKGSMDMAHRGSYESPHRRKQRFQYSERPSVMKGLMELELGPLKHNMDQETRNSSKTQLPGINKDDSISPKRRVYEPPSQMSLFLQPLNSPRLDQDASSLAKKMSRVVVTPPNVVKENTNPFFMYNQKKKDTIDTAPVELGGNGVNNLRMGVSNVHPPLLFNVDPFKKSKACVINDNMIRREHFGVNLCKSDPLSPHEPKHTRISIKKKFDSMVPSNYGATMFVHDYPTAVQHRLKALQRLDERRKALKKLYFKESLEYIAELENL